MKTLAKEGIQFWELDLQPNGDHMGVSGILEIMSNEIQDCELNTESSEIASYLAGFISKKLLKKTICKECKLCEDILTSNLVEEGVDYINQLNRGGLRIPLKHLSTHVIKVFAVLDVVKELLIQHFPDKIKNACEETLRLFVTTDFM